MTWRCVAVGLLVAVIGLVAYVSARHFLEDRTQPPGTHLEAMRLVPPPQAGDEVVSVPLAKVGFVYLLRNSGTEPAKGKGVRTR